jgi:hypothetical protein
MVVVSIARTTHSIASILLFRRSKDYGTCCTVYSSFQTGEAQQNCVRDFILVVIAKMVRGPKFSMARLRVSFGTPSTFNGSNNSL